MKTKLTDFRFMFEGRGAYTVTYTSPKTGKTWTKYITDMGIIDRTKNADAPRIKDLDILKYIVKKINY
jgi:hypothetical protein